MFGWIRVVLALLAVANIATGLWAVFAPLSWFDDFPGWAPRLVAAMPPYNEHLATDAGGGLLATGVAAAVAACWMRRDVVIVAAAAYATAAIPHAVFHIAHPADALTTSENIVNSFTLVIAAVAAVAVLVATVARPAELEHDRSDR